MTAPRTHAVEVAEVEECPTAVVAATITWAELPTTWKGMLDQVWAVLEASPGLRTTGHNVMLYKDDRPAVEIGVQVTRRFEPVGDVVPSVLPAGRVARAIHTGPPADLARAHAAVASWCREHALGTTGVRWEIYGDPQPDGSTPTEVCWQLR
jgi:effector-binding domain-containing protein